MFQPKRSSSGSRTRFVSYCIVITSVCVDVVSKRYKLKVGTNIKYACEFLKIVIRNKRWLWRSVNKKNIYYVKIYTYIYIWDVNVGCNVYKYVRTYLYVLQPTFTSHIHIYIYICAYSILFISL
jgi:hypothetical protein